MARIVKSILIINLNFGGFVTIKELLNGYYSTLPFPFSIVHQKVLSKKLKDDMLNLAKQSPGYIVLNFFINNVRTDNQYNQFHPDVVVDVCKKFGFVEFEDLDKWINSDRVINMGKILINTKLELTELQIIKTSELRNIIDTIPNKANDFCCDYADSEYQVVPEDKIEYILNRFSGNKILYQSETRDCDDFTRIFRGWLSEQNFGNLTIGKCWYKAYNKDNEMVLYHSVVTIVTNKKIYCAEPQRDVKYWPIEETSGMWLSKNIVRTEITRLEF